MNILFKNEELQFSAINMSINTRQWCLLMNIKNSENRNLSNIHTQNKNVRYTPPNLMNEYTQVIKQNNTAKSVIHGESICLCKET